MRSFSELTGSFAVTASTTGPVPSIATGAKAAAGSYGSLYMEAPNAYATEIRSSVWPSGVDRAAASVPMIPPAPLPWLSATTCLPRRSESWKAIMRPTTSLLPPGGKGMTRRSGLVGKVWALAAVAKARANAQRIFRVISSLRLDSGGLDEPSVLFDAAFQHRRKLLGRVGDDGHRELVDLSAHLGVLERRHQLVVQPRGRRGRQRRRAEQPEPGRGLLEARQRLADGGHVGQSGVALRFQHREDFELSR